MAIFGKLAYEEGATVGTLVTVRLGLAAVVLWAVVAAGGGLRAARALRRRHVAAALALGAGGYSLQAGAYFAALHRIDASLVSLLVYTYPAIVALAAVALRRERADGARTAALAAASGGIALVALGAGAGAFDPLGAGLALAAALVYSGYILAGEGLSARVAPLTLTALVCTGAAVTLAVASLALGDLRPGVVTPAGWGWLAALAVISTAAAISLFLAGLRRVRATRAALLSTVEPVVTLGLAFAVFGERLDPAQQLGAMLVLAGVMLLQLPARRPLVRPVPALPEEP
jgi:drug/metabolite transporter (DMT)-like permease